MNSKRLILLTNNFPKSNGAEGVFLRDELKEAIKYFDKIYIVPVDTGFNTKANIPNEKITFIDLNEFSNKFNNFFSAFARISLLLSAILYAFKKKKINFLNLKSLSYEFAYLKQILKLQSSFENFLSTLSSGTLYAYSFWFDIWPIILSKPRLKNKFQNVISRAHGFDIFPEQQKYKFDPFFRVKLKGVNLVSSVSLKGKLTLQIAAPNYKNKFVTMNLGVNQNTEKVKVVDAQKLLIVSCSNITKIKRVFLIPEILKNLTVDYTWVHFGGGVEEDILLLNNSITRNKVNAELKGYISNTELLKFYNENVINLFINVSASEGIPFSIMEAMSFGIPCMATDVGGNTEIVDTNNGFIIPENFDPKTVAGYINEFSLDLQNAKRTQAYNCWKEKFNAEKNYKNFYHRLIGGN